MAPIQLLTAMTAEVLVFVQILPAAGTDRVYSLAFGQGAFGNRKSISVGERVLCGDIAGDAGKMEVICLECSIQIVQKSHGIRAAIDQISGQSKAAAAVYAVVEICIRAKTYTKNVSHLRLGQVHGCS